MQLIAQLLPAFLLIFCRISAFFVVAPVFSFKNVPVQFKIGIIFFISFIIFASNGALPPVVMDSLYILSIIREILVGLILGFTAYILFTAVQVAGSFIDIQMGFGLANVIDPMTGTHSPILGNFKFIIAILLFLSFNGHHYLIHAIIESYRWVPLSNELFANIYNGNVSHFLTRSFTTMFVLAFQMAAPLVATLFLADVALGLLARTAPQFNLFVIGIPLKILLGFIVLLLLVPGYLFLFHDLFNTMFDSLYQLLQLIGTDPSSN